VYNSVADNVTDPVLRDVFPSRAETLRRRLRTLLKKEKQRDAIEKLLESDVDIVVHGIVRMILTLDNTGRKVNNMLLLADFTSVYVARNQFTAESSATQQS
jgi:Arc/MetJ-type ribon-helix-helix transcriptional regulator